MKNLFIPLLVATALDAAMPSADPILRIEAGMHTASIKRIATDAAGRLALTCSDDKTARLWSLPDIRKTDADFKSSLLRVFRVPIGAGNEGKLNACALSPDGSMVAVGGWIGFEWDEATHNIFLFDSASGRLLHRLGGVDNAVLGLAFSASGRSLAAGLGGGGIRIWDAASGQLTGADGSYGNACYGLDWYGDDSLATTCLDGQVRIYRGEKLAASQVSKVAKLVPSRKASSPWKKPALSIRFSPDGQAVALTCLESTATAILSTSDLSLIRRLDTEDLRTGNLAVVDWTADGRSLAGGGRWADEAGISLRLWPEAGKGRPQDLHGVTTDTLEDLRRLPADGWLYASHLPEWGLLVPSRFNSRPVCLGASPIPDYRSAHADAIRLSADATTVGFAYKLLGGIPATFSLNDRELKLRPPARTLRVPHVDGVPFTQCRPPLVMQPGETLRSVAISDDGSFVALGTDYWLRSYTAAGRQLWKQAVPSIAMAINLSADGRIVVTAFNDGTIRWHRADTGEELLAFFPHADRKRWVLWTPAGFYDSSEGGEDLLGWHVNRGKDQPADFFPAARFKAVFRRPDVIHRVLKTLDVSKAFAQANAAIGRAPVKPQSIAEVIARLSPPVVELASGGVRHEVVMEPDAREVAVRFSVRSTGEQKAESVKITFNGRPLMNEVAVPEPGQEMEVKVPVPDGLEGCLSIIASHRLAASEAAILHVRRSPASTAKPAPELYVITAGVSKLKANATPSAGKGGLAFDDLRSAHTDASRLASSLETQGGKAFAHTHKTILVNEAASHQGIRDALNEVAAQARAGDVVIFSFAGHGYAGPKTDFFLVCHDFDNNHFEETALTGSELAALLAPIKASVVLILDTCMASAVLGKQDQDTIITGPGDFTGLINTLGSSERGIVVLSSASEKESALESAKGGIFTDALVEGLKGGAAINGVVTCGSLQDYVAHRVPNILEEREKGGARRQTPQAIMPANVPDFTLAKP